MALPNYICHRTNGPITIDGRPNEPAWEKAQAVSLVRNQDGGPAQFSTSVRLLWDDRYLYVSFVCEDPDIWGTMRERDSHLWEEEVVEVFLDGNQNGKLYFEFEVSPLNVQLDLMVVKRPGEPSQPFFAWDCRGWETAVWVDGDVNERTSRDHEWSVEMAIPLDEIYTTPRHPQPGDTWRLGLYRIERPQGTSPHLYAWSPTRDVTFHVPERFGFLTFSI
ncbi:MAG: carbohydrate-binding family 9-like protein [Anaerolineae bacterium]|nr:carbohydrate-binding family 9-like protein [Anaerolineae bacterium]